MSIVNERELHLAVQRDLRCREVENRRIEADLFGRIRAVQCELRGIEFESTLDKAARRKCQKQLSVFVPLYRALRGYVQQKPDSVARYGWLSLYLRRYREMMKTLPEMPLAGFNGFCPMVPSCMGQGLLVRGPTMAEIKEALVALEATKGVF